MTGFVFFSVLTTGSDLLVDNVTAVSAIRTDHEFKELARVEFRLSILRVETPSHDTPDAGAWSLSSHYLMMRQVAETFAKWSPAIFVGCDAMQANDRFLRRALYLTLHDPFLTTSFGSGRTDVIRMVEMAAVHAPGSIVIPRGPDRTPTFELSLIARANGIDVGQDETAMRDVEAALGIAQLLADRSPEVVSSCARFSQPASVRHFVEENSIVLLTRRFASRLHTRHVTSLTADLDPAGECLVFDLSIEPEELSALDDDALGLRLESSPKPVSRIRVNACPIFSEFDETMPILGMETDDLMRRAEFLSASPEFRVRLVMQFLSASERLPSEAQLKGPAFEPFLDHRDRESAAAFHQAAPDERLRMKGSFSNGRLNEIAARLLAVA